MSSKFKVTKGSDFLLTHIPFIHVNLSSYSWDTFFENLTMKIQGQGHSSSSHSASNTLSIHIPFVPCYPSHSWNTAFFKFDLKNSRSGSWESSKSQSVFHLLSIHIFHSVFEKLQVLMPWISRHGSCLYLLSYFPLKHTFPLSQLPLTSSVFPSFHLGPVLAGIIFHLHAVPSVVLLQCHTSAAVPSIVPLCHPSYTFHPSPSLSRTIPAATGTICPISTPSPGCIVPLPIRSTAEWNVTWSELNIINILFKWQTFIYIYIYI